jgi:hypothetical protein
MSPDQSPKIIALPCPCVNEPASRTPWVAASPKLCIYNKKNEIRPIREMPLKGDFPLRTDFISS